MNQSIGRIESATIPTGKAVVRLNGQIDQRDECDAPRLQAQLEKTARQLPSVRRPLADVWSLEQWSRFR